MGLFDFFKAPTKEKKIQTYARKIRNKDTPVEERQTMAVWLADEGSHDAVVAMLGRFEMNYEHTMKDQQEKQDVYRLVLGLGPAAVEPLETFLARCKQFARPLAAYEKLGGKAKARTLVLSLLDEEFVKSELKPKKKTDLLIKLADYRGDDVTASAKRFLNDFDEGCRYAAAEVLIAQPETPGIVEALLAILADPNEESGRLRHRIAEAAATRRWALGEHEAALAERLPANFTLSAGILVAG